MRDEKVSRVLQLECTSNASVLNKLLYISFRSAFTFAFRVVIDVYVRRKTHNAREFLRSSVQLLHFTQEAFSHRELPERSSTAACTRLCL